VGLLHLFQGKGLLPRTLTFAAALGDLDEVQQALHENANDLAKIEEAFITACRFEHASVASLLLERSITLDPDLGEHVDEGPGRSTFVKFLIEDAPLDRERATALGPWKAFIVGKVLHALDQGDLATFNRVLQRERWLLGNEYVWLQNRVIETATLKDREEFIVALLDLSPALLRREPPTSQAIELSLTYAHTNLLPLLARIWPVPDDLPHAAGLGNLSRVKEWFDDSGAPALGDLEGHYPYNDKHAREQLHWNPPTLQQVLDTAFAFAVINRHFDVADFLLEHGADVNTNWNSHEPASILHHLVFENNYESMQYLIDRGIDLTITDYRWNSTARGWALYGKKDEKMAEWLEQAERAREEGAR